MRTSLPAAAPFALLTASLGLLLAAWGCGEPYSYVLDPADFDRSCAVDADCVPIFSGELCECLRCKDAAIARSDSERYAKVFREVSVHCSGVTCGQSEAFGTDAGSVVECHVEAFCDEGVCAVRQAR